MIGAYHSNNVDQCYTIVTLHSCLAAVNNIKQLRSSQNFPRSHLQGWLPVWTSINLFRNVATTSKEAKDTIGTCSAAPMASVQPIATSSTPPAFGTRARLVSINRSAPVFPHYKATNTASFISCVRSNPNIHRSAEVWLSKPTSCALALANTFAEACAKDQALADSLKESMSCIPSL